MKPQRIMRAGMSRSVVRLPVQHARRWGGSKWLKRRMVRVVTLVALQPNQPALRRIPISIAAAMRTVLPIPVHGAMTLGTQFLGLIPGDLAAEIVRECLSIRCVVAIEAARVDAMRQLKLAVLGHFAAGGARLGFRAVAFTAPERETAYRVQSEQTGLSDGRRVRRRCGSPSGGDRGTVVTWGKPQQYRGNGQNRRRPGEFLAPL